ncbi:MAG: LicD family protein [Clostridium sp.]|nr:LicD family protein [Bacteroides sp.]MCM1197287.1 LicD family protein [Clostridium sp.]
MTEKETRIFKEKLVLILKEYDTFCRKHGLRYSIAYGTMIGAIRHKGIIPWDDDIDIYMPRPDYERFIAMTDKEGISSGYKVRHGGNTEQYYLSFAKVYDSGTTIVEYANTVTCPLGVFIDVFPLDGESADPVIQKKKYRQYKKLNRGLWYVNNLPASREPRFLIKRFIYRTLLHRTPGWYINRLSHLGEEFENSSKMRAWSCPANIMERTWFDELIEVEFEGLKVKCFKEYDKYLRLEYGDYMQLPPKEQQISNHHHYILDLENGWKNCALLQEELKKRHLLPRNP